MVDLTQFALTGDKTPILDADLPNGFSCGNFSRQTLNWLLAQAFGQGTSLNTPTWTAGNYPSGSITSLAGKQYRNESCGSTTAMPPDAPWVERTTAELYANPMGNQVVTPLHCPTATYSPGSIVSAGGVTYRQEGDADTAVSPPAAPWAVRTTDELYANPVGTPLAIPLWYAGSYNPGAIRSHNGVMYRQEGSAPTTNAPPAAPWAATTMEGAFANPVGCQLTVPFWAAGNYAPDAVVCFGGNYYINRSASVTSNVPPALPWEQVSLVDLLGASSIKWLRAGQSLPATNLGPVWSDTYNSLMTWQTFNANGASYTGYASQDIGRLILESQPTPRQGWVKSGVSNLSKTAYAALWNWAVHNGLQVSSGVWASGNLMYADNGDGTFRVADVRGQFPRFWSDGHTTDNGRAFGTGQLGSLMYANALYGWNDPAPGEWVDGCPIPSKAWSQVYRNQFGAMFDDVQTSWTTQAATMTNIADIGTFTACLGQGSARPTNAAFLAAIKF